MHSFFANGDLMGLFSAVDSRAYASLGEQAASTRPDIMKPFLVPGASRLLYGGLDVVA